MTNPVSSISQTDPQSLLVAPTPKKGESFDGPHPESVTPPQPDQVSFPFNPQPPTSHPSLKRKLSLCIDNPGAQAVSLASGDGSIASTVISPGALPSVLSPSCMSAAGSTAAPPLHSPLPYHSTRGLLAGPSKQLMKLKGKHELSVVTTDPSPSRARIMEMLQKRRDVTDSLLKARRERPDRPLPAVQVASDVVLEVSGPNRIIGTVTGPDGQTKTREFGVHTQPDGLRSRLFPVAHPDDPAVLHFKSGDPDTLSPGALLTVVREERKSRKPNSVTLLRKIQAATVQKRLKAANDSHNTDGNKVNGDDKV